MKVRLLSLLLCASLLASAFALAACGSSNTEQTPSSGDASAVEAVTEPEETRLMPDLPDTKFDGASMRYMTSDGNKDTVVRYYNEVSVDETNGELMNDSIYARSRRLEDQYGIKFENQIVAKADMANTFTASMTAAEDNWEVIVPHFKDAMTFAVAGIYLADLNSIPHVDLDMPWWDTRVANDLSVAHHRYVAIGAMNTWTDSHTYAVVFNKDLEKDFGIDSYAMVHENKWTLDNFNTAMSKVTADIDGNGVMDNNDRWGAASERANFYMHMTGCGIKTVQHDENDIPVYKISSSFYDAANKVFSVIRGGNCLIAEDYKSITSDPWTDVLRKSFRAGNILYYVGGMEQLLIFRDFDGDIGLLPLPKYDENQAEYSHPFSTSWATVQAVPYLNSKREMTGVILEALNADSYYSTAVDYFDVVIKYKAMRDEESYNSLQIIRGSRTADFEYGFGYLKMNSIYSSIVANSDISGLASSITANMESAVAQLNKTMEQISKQ